MRKIIVGGFLSLDGVMQAPGGPTEDPTGGFPYGGWIVPYWDDATDAFVDEMFARPFDLLLGRNTYDIFAAYWPFAGEDSAIGTAFGRVTKYVVTSSSEPLSWENSVALRGADVVAEITRLKQGDGPDLLTQGSTVLLKALLEQDLVDELRLLTFPLILGKGKRLFGAGSHPAALRLTHQAASTTGVIMSVYERAGAITTGSFGSDDPSPAEIARRDKMAREG